MNLPRRPAPTLGRAGLRAGVVLAWALAAPWLCAQTAITSITTTFTTGSSTSHVTLDSGTVTMDNDKLAVNTLADASGNTYTVTGSANAGYIRTNSTSRNPDTGSPNPDQVSAWYMGNASSSTANSPTTLYGSYNSGTAGSLLLGNNLLEGSDNTFNNTEGSVPNNGDIERLDLVYNGTTGVTANNFLSVGVFDRGVGDNFKIAIITGVDTNGNPTSYGGNLISVSASDFGGELLNHTNANSTILNSSGEPNDYLLRYDSTTSLASGNNVEDDQSNHQNISGVVFTMTDFGIASGTKIYGYSIMAGDVTDGGNINNLINYHNTTFFPTNTDQSSGLDPVAVNGVLFEEHPLPEPSTYGAIFCGLGLGGIMLLRHRQQQRGLRNTA